ncbi:TolC family protein [Chondrinema litorale]|uniref:TolC family protein n=1 Tax=Chondrinema litorale TaxID=2994555 RepID=UPI0025430C0F|nr:TolC family protein [Chondrinema litorale]UZR97770.1 TolC family protein [Chondrinema litorale]
MMKKRWMVAQITCLLLFAFSGIRAQNQPMTLKECIDFGLENHRSNKVYQNNILAAEAKIQESKAGYLPHVNLTGTLDDNLKVQTSVIPGDLVGSDEDQRIAFTKQFSTNVSAQLDQKIYDQSLITSLKLNKFSKQEAMLNKELNDEAIIYNIVTAFYQVLVSQEQHAYLKEDIETYKQQLEVAELQLEKGVLTEVDKNKIQVNYYNTLSQLNVAENTLTYSENQLKNQMGLPLTDAVQIDTASLSTIVAELTIQQTESEFTPSTRTEYKLSNVNISMLQIDEKRIRAQALPTLSAYAKYGGVGFGDDLSESFSTITDFATIGLKLSIPLFDGFERSAKVKQAKYELANAQENLKLDTESYTLEYENARNELVKARTNIDNDHRTLDLSKSVFKATDLQYQKGVTDLTDWLETQRSLKESQSNYINSLFSYYEAIFELEKMKGTLKNFYNALQ